MKRIFLSITSIACGLFLTACGTAEQTATTASPAPAATVAPAAPAPEPEPSVVKVENSTQADGSEVTVKNLSDGSVTEERTFKKGPILKVKRVTKKDGTVTAHAVRREGETEVEIKDESWIKKAMNATGESLAKATDKTKDVGEKVGDETKKDAKIVGGEVKEGAEKVGSGVKKGVKATGEGAKKVVDKVKKAVTN